MLLFASSLPSKINVALFSVACQLPDYQMLPDALDFAYVAVIMYRVFTHKIYIVAL